MKKVVLAVLAFSFTLAANAEVKTLRKRTGKEQIITTSACSSPALGVATDIYQSSFSKVVCREYMVYQADVQGTFWNRSESQIGEARYDYALETENITATDVDFSQRANTGNPTADVLLDAANVGMRMSFVLSQCNRNRQVLQSVAMPVSASKCAGQ